MKSIKTIALIGLFYGVISASDVENMGEFTAPEADNDMAFMNEAVEASEVAATPTDFVINPEDESEVVEDEVAMPEVAMPESVDNGIEEVVEPKDQIENQLEQNLDMRLQQDGEDSSEIGALKKEILQVVRYNFDLIKQQAGVRVKNQEQRKQESEKQKQQFPNNTAWAPKVQSVAEVELLELRNLLRDMRRVNQQIAKDIVNNFVQDEAVKEITFS